MYTANPNSVFIGFFFSFRANSFTYYYYFFAQGVDFFFSLLTNSERDGKRRE